MQITKYDKIWIAKKYSITGAFGNAPRLQAGGAVKIRSPLDAEPFARE
jgi:hypothetical protein